MKELNSTVFSLLWTQKTDKIKRNVITQEYENGGLKMLDIKAFIFALKSTWFRRILNTEGIWQNIISQFFDIKLLLKFGAAYVEKVIDQQTNLFWKDILKAWKLLQEKSEKVSMGFTGKFTLRMAESFLTLNSVDIFHYNGADS